MADAILYGIAEEILKHIGSNIVEELASTYGFKTDLNKLKRTINTIKDYLLEVEEKQSDSDAVRNWLLTLSNVVYRADDLFDEFATVVSRKHTSDGNKFIKEVRTFFSHYNQISYARSVSHRIKAIREELGDIMKYGNGLNLVQRSYVEGRVVTRRDESYSVVGVDEIIGRDVDKNAILELLLASSSRDDENEPGVLPVVSIVGMGGMGKTALVQLVYNDPLVKEFFNLRLWVCVSEVFDVKEITGKILMSVTSAEVPKVEMEPLQGMLRKEIGDNKYLLVLDDVWNENREEWLKMRAILKIVGRKGSKILVTTRLSNVANVMCTYPPYDLHGLSEEKSWELFEKLAFAPIEAQQMTHLVCIGREIVQKCANVPLAIRSLGSILYGKEESEWLSIKDQSLSKVSNKGIVDILKISYHYIESPLKNCFAYCSLFPKDYNFKKNMLIDLWMAEGFLVPDVDEGQSLEELGEEYFLSLLQRGFFQEVNMDKWGCIESCKMHDLIHDLAQEVAKTKCKVMKSNENSNLDKTYHLSFAYRLNFQRTIPKTVLSSKQLRTLLLPQQSSDGSTFSKSMCQQIVSSLKYLRVLDLHGIGLINLPTSIGKLIHLRYLDLSLNPITVLPDSITELYQLQTLNLNHCEMLYTLPVKIKKLVNLRSLDIGNCLPMFDHMPLGIGKLTSLHKLPLFIVCKKPNSARLSELKKLNNLRGKLHVVFFDHLDTTMLEAREGDLTYKQGLNDLELDFPIGEHFLSSNDISDIDEVVPEPEIYSIHDEVVIEGLKPHSNLRVLKISNYKGRKLPIWAMRDNLVLTLPKIVEIELYEWNHCQLPTFSQLPLLKRLSLVRLLFLEYIETINCNYSSTIFFPSLEILELLVMYKLKGWRKKIDTSHELQPTQPSLSFPKLTILNIHRCKNLALLPTCPNIEKVHMSNENKGLSILKIVTDSSRLKSLTIDNVDDLLSIQQQCLLELSSLCIKDPTLVSTEKLRDFFSTLSSSLKSLSLENCDNLVSISKGLEHLTSLEKLSLYYCNELDLSLNEQNIDCEDMPWKTFKTSLRSLRLFCLRKLANLPSGIQQLTNLRSLEILYNHELRELPEWISCCSSLEYLRLGSCNNLTSLPESFRKLTSLHELEVLCCSKINRKMSRSKW